MRSLTPDDRRRLRTIRRRRARAAERRGVLMLVVLSMLVLFLLIGTTFLLTSSQYRTASKIVEKANRTTFQPEDVLERALMQVLRDTNNAHSVVRYHSLLRDLYGADGFVGTLITEFDDSELSTFIDPLPKYAGATDADVLGPTNGQLVDLYVEDDNSGGFNDGDVVGLDLDEDGVPIAHRLSTTDGYYNGCLLTMLDGPCRGVSVRVVEYDYVGTDDAANASNTVGRFRVMAPRRLDGQSLQFGAGDETLTDFVATTPAGVVGRRFIVNGRPFNGAGVGFNAYASPNAARLTAAEAIDLDPSDENRMYAMELALIPNPVHFVQTAVVGLRRNAGTDPFQIPPGATGNLYNDQYYELDAFSVLAGADPSTRLYQGYVGPGGADESYDAADFQNMFLALQSPQPRWRGRVVSDIGGSLGANGLRTIDPGIHYAGGDAAPPVRLDLEDVTIPSFHRPALTNFWFHRLLNSAWLTELIGDPNARARAILQPYDDDGAPQNGLDAATAAQITAIKRKFSLRPLREDHPEFDGSNALSRYVGTNLGAAINSSAIVNENTGEITFPYWEAVGPWDVDNDGDGAPDSVWVDLGLPVQKTEDGRLYKPLVALLIEDLDGRLNLNAHGSTEHFVNDDLDATDPFGSGLGNLAQDYDSTPALFTSDQLPHGSGWGPADISLRPILSPDLPLSDYLGLTPGLTADAQYDDYARLLVGRPDPADAGRSVLPAVASPVTWGRYGTALATGDVEDASVGRNFDPNALAATREERVPYDFAGYPETALEDLRFSGFGERPDLMSRYGFGIGPLGSPVREAVSDGWIAYYAGEDRSILDDSPYEMDLSADARRRTVADLATVVANYNTANPINDDAPFSPAELERLLRAFDADADKLPDRLWELVDAFDPEKLTVQEAIASDTIDPDNFANWNPDTLRPIAAAMKAAINRRQVTTESFDVPAPNENWTARLLLGADGLPGVPFEDDDGDGFVDEGDEAVIGYNEAGSHTFSDGTEVLYADLYAAGCDDYVVIAGADPPPNARITDYLRYRTLLELYRSGVITTATADETVDRLVNQIVFGVDAVASSEVRDDGAIDHYSFGGLLAPEVFAGLKMDLNRPFGDGRDNNGNGVVDEPQEAGEPYVDRNGNGTWDSGEPYHDLDYDGRFYADANGDGALTNADWADFDNDGVFEPIVDSLWPTEPGGPYPFDYTRGADANGRGAFVDTNNDEEFQSGEPRIYDDARMARQLYARHLYCLMLALVDDGYLAPYDEADPQVRHFLDPKSGRLATSGDHLPVAGSSFAYRLAFEIGERFGATAGDDPNETGFPPLAWAEARRQAMRKLTCRQIAQWAINCVDIRDPDAIQTPFEYDENPWDGWNVVDPVEGQVFPIDGDLATDENGRFFREITANGWTQDTSDSDQDGDFEERVLRATAADTIRLEYQTRGVVWGAERPELLMTEGLALHDRRLTDEALSGSVEGPSDAGDDATPPDDLGTTEDPNGDDDLDQLLRPRGRAFVELYNPWTADDQQPRELYSRQTGFLTQPGIGDPTDYSQPIRPNLGYVPDPDTFDLDVDGVALDRLSNSSAVRFDSGRRWYADRRMLIDPAGFREPPEPKSRPSLGDPSDAPDLTTGEVVNNPTAARELIYAASPVWRVICVEEHPDVRNDPPSNNRVEDDNPTDGSALGDMSPYAYSPRTATTVDGDRLPEAYVEVWRQRNNPPGAGNGPPSDRPFLQPDPDWPEFDRFARPGSTSSTGITEEVQITVPYVTVDANDDPINAEKPAARLQLAKPDRYIERAWYFFGAPEINPPEALSAATPHKPRRNLIQPGLVVPDLSYEIYPSTNSGIDLDLVQDQVQFDLQADTDLGPSELKTLDEWRESGSGGIAVDAAATAGLDFYDIVNTDRMQVSGNRFIVTDRFDADNDLELSAGTTIPTDVEAVIEPLPVAPILPGRYAVIGAAHAPYETDTQPIDLGLDEDVVRLTNRYTQILSREYEGISADYLKSWERLRRIELIPSSDPDRHQVVVRFNGHPEGSSIRLSEVYPLDANSDPINLTELPVDPDDPFGNTFGGVPRLIQPVVAIPMDGFNISEPLDGYHLRRNEIVQGASDVTIRIAPSRYNPGGQTLSVGDEVPVNALHGFDQPLDFLPEITNDQTTPAYRTLHLQRLANPLLAWNPPPFRPDGDPVVEHDPGRPVNPYLTVDSLPMDLISYNGSEPPPISGTGQDDPPLASVERGVSPDVPQRDPNATTVAGVAGVAASIDPAELTPRDLWSATTSLLASRIDGDIYNDVRGHPDAAFFDSVDTTEGAGSGRPPHKVALQHSLGFANRGAGALLIDDDLPGAAVANVDLNGDLRTGELVGAPAIDTNNNVDTDDNPYAALHWPNRPFVSAAEIMLTPMWSSSRLLTHYSTFNASLASQPNPYNGDSLYDNSRNWIAPENLQPSTSDAFDAPFTNRVRWRNERAPFGHLLPFFSTASAPARALPWQNPDNDRDVAVIAYGAPHYYRILDYVRVPSRYVETDTLLNPQVFGERPPTFDNPRVGLTAPFNRVDSYREPGRINLNTVGTRRDTVETPSSGPQNDRLEDLWSEVYDGLMHRRQDVGAIDHDGGQLLQAGHLGPAWRDVVVSRRGYVARDTVTGRLSLSPGALNANFPTLFANPLRSPDGGYNVPLAQLQHGGVDATMLRAHVKSPGEDGAWGDRLSDDNVVDKNPQTDVAPNRNLIRDDAGEAGAMRAAGVDTDDVVSTRNNLAVPDSLLTGALSTYTDRATSVPMFSGASTEPSLNAERNPQLRYAPLTRLANLTSGRSGVFAVWITVGYFEVTSVNPTDTPEIWARYDPDGDGVVDDELEDLFFRVYQDGYTLGREIDLEIGENRRMRGFYLIDRTLPVAFKPGDDLNVENAILLRRRIE